MSSLLDRLNAALAKKTEQDLLNSNKKNDYSEDNSQFDDDGWLESGKAASFKIVPNWETKVRVVDLYRLVWAPLYSIHNAKMCAVLCDNKEILAQKGERLPVDGEVVVEIFNMDKEGPRKHSRLVLVYEKELLSYNGNKRDMKYPIDHRQGFSGDNTEPSWDMRLMDKMYNVLEDKFHKRPGKHLFDTKCATANSFLKLALEEDSKNKDMADEMERMPISDEKLEDNPKPRVDIRSFAPAPKSVAVTQTLAVGDWICWTHKVFKNSVVCAKIVNITDDSGSPLELSTLDTIRGHDAIQKCFLRKREDIKTSSHTVSTSDAVSSSSSAATEGGSSEIMTKKGEALFGREAMDEVDFYTDNEGILRPRGGSFQLMSQFKLIRGNSIEGESSDGYWEVKGPEETEMEDVMLSTRRKSGTMSLKSPMTGSGVKRQQSSPSLTVSPVVTPRSTIKKGAIHSVIKSPTENAKIHVTPASISKRQKTC